MSPRIPTLTAWLDGHPVAELREVRSRQVVWSWTQDAVARWGEGAVVVSASLPVQSRAFSVGRTRPFIEGLLLEGEARTAVERAFEVPRGDVFRLLAAVGGDCAGALQILPDGVRPGTAPEPGPLEPGELERLVRNLPQHPLGTGDGVRLSLAGMQDKLLLTRRSDGRWARPVGGYPSTHILKPQPETFPDLVAAEWFGLALARAVGLDAARAEVIEVDDRPVLVVERYDRTVTAGGGVDRIQQEDFCQACGRLPEQKYEADGGPGWRELAGVLRAVAADPRAELERLARVLVLTVLSGNADAHARNLSILHPPTGSRLAPVYDVVPTVHLARTPGAVPLGSAMAMAVDGTWDVQQVQRDDVLAELASWPLPTRVAARVVADVVDRAYEFASAQPGACAQAVAQRASSWR
ncbi:HipA domain-containing protein [Kineococcus sp. SYSU DK003]|uniref:HipA domain-containing protein n=1 Tax=Kineococcus sp. SYSU DK003 TaxID=3383124 RepID=UPI003D7C3D2C